MPCGTGWIVENGQPESTGRFTDPTAVQELNPARDLEGLEAWVTLEPEPDDSLEPYLRVLIDPAIDAAPGEIEMEPASPLPEGTLTVVSADS